MSATQSQDSYKERIKASVQQWEEELRILRDQESNLDKDSREYVKVKDYILLLEDRLAETKKHLRDAEEYDESLWKKFGEMMHDALKKSKEEMRKAKAKL